MTIIQAIILGIIEGLTEFLPISSTGHMILASHILKIQSTDFTSSFEIIIQLGAIAAVVVFYLKRLYSLRTLWKPLLAAFLPSAVIGLLLYKLIKVYLLNNDLLVVATLALGGIVLLFSDRIAFTHSQEGDLQSITLAQAIKIGIGQALSIIPGVSRSAATIIAGGIVGLNKKNAVEFSFLLAIPTMLAATALDVVKMKAQFSSSEITLIIFGTVTAFTTAFFAIKFFLEYVQKHSFKIFGVYRIGLAIVYLILKVLLFQN